MDEKEKNNVADWLSVSRGFSEAHLQAVCNEHVIEEKTSINITPEVSMTEIGGILQAPAHLSEMRACPMTTTIRRKREKLKTNENR